MDALTKHVMKVLAVYSFLFFNQPQATGLSSCSELTCHLT
jgi:hypothetical protein